MEEIEVKFLDIDPDGIENKLSKIGAKKVFDRVFEVKVFDFPDFRLDSNHSWVRIRNEGDAVRMSFKKRLGVKKQLGKDDGMMEYETEVGSFEQAEKILKNIGLIEKFCDEKHRIEYDLNGMKFDIDHAPGILPYLEIEAESWGKIDEAIKLLGLDKDDQKICSLNQIYKMNGISPIDYKEFKFSGLVKRKPNEYPIK